MKAGESWITPILTAAFAVYANKGLISGARTILKGAAPAAEAAGAAGEVAGVAAGAAGEVAAGTAGAAGEVAGVAALSKLLGGAKFLGPIAAAAAATLDVGLGINDLTEGKRQTEMPGGWDMANPMRWGMYGGEKVNQGIGLMTGGQNLGSLLYDAMHDEIDINAPTPITRNKNLAGQAQPVPAQPVPASGSAAAEIAQASGRPPLPMTASKSATTNQAEDENEKLMSVLSTTSDGVTRQVAQLDMANTLMQQLVDTSQLQMNIAEKQLIALTLTDKEKGDAGTKAALRRDNKFGAQYGYV
jgi:hypothetical protein